MISYSMNFWTLSYITVLCIWKVRFMPSSFVIFTFYIHGRGQAKPPTSQEPFSRWWLKGKKKRWRITSSRGKEADDEYSGLITRHCMSDLLTVKFFCSTNSFLRRAFASASRFSSSRTLFRRFCSISNLLKNFRPRRSWARISRSFCASSLSVYPCRELEV